MKVMAVSKETIEGTTITKGCSITGDFDLGLHHRLDKSVKIIYLVMPNNYDDWVEVEPNSVVLLEKIKNNRIPHIIITED